VLSDDDVAVTIHRALSLNSPDIIIKREELRGLKYIARGGSGKIYRGTFGSHPIAAKGG
jgi:hypothetical protein